MDFLQIFLFNCLNGLVWGLIIAIIALGLSLIFGLIEIVNVAHGALFMLGAVTGWYIVKYSSSFWLALAISPLLIGGVGLLLERAVLRPIEDKPIMTILATFGLMLIFQQTVLGIFGGSPQSLPSPFPQWLPLLGFKYPAYRVFVGLLSVATIFSLWLFLHRTKYGTWMRAVKQDREMAAAIGIPVDAVYMFTFGLGSALAAMAGVLAAPIITVEFEMGLKILIAAFIVAVIGGLGSIGGSVLAAIMIGELEGISSVFVTPQASRIFSLVFMIIILIIRPYGLFRKP